MSTSLRCHNYGSNFGSPFAEVIVSNCALVILITSYFRRSFVLIDNNVVDLAAIAMSNHRLLFSLCIRNNLIYSSLEKKKLYKLKTSYLNSFFTEF